MSSFNQQETVARPLPYSDRDTRTAGSTVQHRSSDLRPRLRGNSRGKRKELNPVSSSFPTNIGLRKIPRQISATRPDAAMIRNARRGVMSKFLRSGTIIRASDLGTMVDPKSAIISLTNTIEMETDHLSDEEDPMPESERNLENLFYICVQGDELPSYHFWRGKDDPDPINVHRPIDWHGIIHSNTVAEMNPAQTGDSEWETLPSNPQERLIRREDPKGLSHEAVGATEFDDSYETTQRKEGTLEFLDFYDDTSKGESILQRGKLMPGRNIHRKLGEQSQQLGGGGGGGGHKLNEQNVQTNPLVPDSDTDTSNKNQQRASYERVDRFLKKTEEEEKLHNEKKGRQVPTDPSSTDDLSKDRHIRYNSGLSPESVYKNSNGEIQLPHYTSTLDWEITSGPDMPTIYARVPTLSEIRILQRRVWRLENWVLQREDYCRVCDQTFVYGASDIEEHYREHRLGLVCPCCQQDWREKTRQDQIAHLALSHQLGPPLAHSSLGTAEGSASPNAPLMAEIVCTFNGCHAPLQGLTADERSDHAEMHARMNQLSQLPNLCSFLGCHVNLNTLKEREREEHTLMHTLTHNSQASTSEREPSLPLNRPPLVNPAPMASPGPPVNPTPGQSPTKPPPDTDSSPHAKTAPKPISPESGRERDPHGRILRSPNQGWYCALCYTNVTSLGLTKQKNHARNCKTTLHEFLVLTKDEAAQLKKVANSGAAETVVDNNNSLIEMAATSTPSKATRAQGKKRQPGTSAYRPEPAKDSSSSESEEKNVRRKKRKLAAETNTPSPRRSLRRHNVEG